MASRSDITISARTDVLDRPVYESVEARPGVAADPLDVDLVQPVRDHNDGKGNASHPDPADQGQPRCLWHPRRRSR